MMMMRLYGNDKLPSTCTPPLIHEGFSTPTFCAPKMLRTNCISIRLMPQVANRVSSGRPYKKRMTDRSNAAPISADAMKATGKDANRYQSK